MLDGRALNGHTWVFYGALSTVEYTLTMTDTLTGLRKAYRNPPGRLASGADTAALRAGFSVVPALDEERAVMQLLGVDGGTLQATAHASPWRSRRRRCSRPRR